MIAAIAQSQVDDDLSVNLERSLNSIRDAAKACADLIVFPELWNSPFINRKILEHQSDSDSILDAFSHAAKAEKIWIVAGTIPFRRKDGHLYNTCFVFDDQGKIVTSADKLHLLEVHTSKNDYREVDVFTPGSRIVSFDSPWGRIGIVICMDTRFCEISRLLSQDCFLLCACCAFNSQAGRKHWMPLMQARAIENEVFVLAANPAEADYGNYSGYGHSMAVDPDGQIVAALDGKPGLLLVDIDPNAVKRIRQRSPYWQLRRTDLYRLEEIGPSDQNGEDDPDKSLNT